MIAVVVVVLFMVVVLAELLRALPVPRGSHGDIAWFGRGHAELLILFALDFWNLCCSLE